MVKKSFIYVFAIANGIKSFYYFDYVMDFPLNHISKYIHRLKVRHLKSNSIYRNIIDSF